MEAWEYRTVRIHATRCRAVALQGPGEQWTRHAALAALAAERWTLVAYAYATREGCVRRPAPTPVPDRAVAASPARDAVR